MCIHYIFIDTVSPVKISKQSVHPSISFLMQIFLLFGDTITGGEKVAKKKRNKNRNRNMEELAEELGLSGGPRDKRKRETFTVRNAGQGQIPKRKKNK